jgi:hypothetical protein
LRLERVIHWERIASRWRPAFSSHLINAAVIVHVDFSTKLTGHMSGLTNYSAALL